MSDAAVARWADGEQRDVAEVSVGDLEAMECAEKENHNKKKAEVYFEGVREASGLTVAVKPRRDREL